MKLETGWNHCTLKAEDEEDHKLLVLLFRDIENEGDVIMDFEKGELSIHTYH